ncbi:hypothetical protein DL93DRAFT_874129 [Clavulina sp. PMI_390]|nr:hypothetical protein DL93DRAFT_874129 [Clavulina sp. PMI_390]
MHASFVRNSVRTAALAAKAGSPLVHVVSLFSLALAPPSTSQTFPPIFLTAHHFILLQSSVSRRLLRPPPSRVTTLLPSLLPQRSPPSSSLALPALPSTPTSRRPAVS